MITLISSIIFGIGLFYIIAGILKFPDQTYIKPLLRFKEKDNEKSIVETLKNKIYFRILNLIKLDEIKRNKLEKNLFLANINKTPEEYVCMGIAEAILILFIGMPVVLINQFIAIVILAIAIFRYLEYMKEPYKKIQENRELIESQLYRFVSIIEQELLVDTDVTRILENFKNQTNKIFKRQLEITLTEMRTMDEITALVKLEARINSTMLSDVVRGLISLTKGENNREYFSMLSNSFKTIYINQKRKEASLLPDKLKKYEWALFGAIAICLGAMFFGVFTSESSILF